MHLTEDIPELLDLVREAEQSEKNQANRDLWGIGSEAGRHQWAGLPQPDSPCPITIEPEAPMWTDILGFRLDRFYTQPEEYLRRSLQMKLYRFERWEENTCVDRRIPIWLGVTLEPSLFGVQTVYQERACPWISKEPVITSHEDLAGMSEPEFCSSGIMPIAHRVFEGIREMLPDDFDVDFPNWERSPFGVCTHLRGTENLLMDLMQDQTFARDQLRFVTHCRRQWVRDRADFLGCEIEEGVLLNDEVNGTMFHPRLYKEFILPTEMELGEFQGISYWHSCGDTTEFLELIHRIPGLRLFHVGPWTDVGRAAEVMGDLALQVCLDPVRDIQRAEESHIVERLEEVFTACEGLAFTIRADGLHTIDTLEPELETVDRWLDIARAVRERHV
jgi:hypothetical protein